MQISRLFLKKWCSFVSTVLIFKKSNFHLLQWASNGIVKKLKDFSKSEATPNEEIMITLEN